MFMMGDFVATILTVLPLIVLAIIIRWIRQIKINSDTQVEQNKQIIKLLQENKSK
ncbi:hypothetical protein QMK38_03575 [Lysinibacillus fusiformis]|nr:hypothetical protein [Lysinibacillus fusiformis]